jgi:hypothetical protein
VDVAPGDMGATKAAASDAPCAAMPAAVPKYVAAVTVVAPDGTNPLQNWRSERLAVMHPARAPAARESRSTASLLDMKGLFFLFRTRDPV